MKKFMTLLYLLCSLAVASNVMAYSVTLTPNSQILNIGDEALVDVNLLLNPGEELFGFNLAFIFDPSILRFNDLLFNDEALTDYITGFTAPTAANPDIVTFNGALFELAGVTSSIPQLASLSFTGIGAGVSPLGLTGSVLDFNALNEVSVSDSGSATVVPEPGTFMLVGLGLAGLLGFRRKFSRN